MKIKYLTFIGTALVLAMSNSVVVAQTSSESSNQTPEIELSAEGQEILCQRFPLNSRCQGNTNAAPAGTSPTDTTSPENTTTPQNGDPSITQPGTPDAIESAPSPDGTTDNTTTPDGTGTPSTPDGTGTGTPGDPSITQPGTPDAIESAPSPDGTIAPEGGTQNVPSTDPMSPGSTTDPGMVPGAGDPNTTDPTGGGTRQELNQSDTISPGSTNTPDTGVGGAGNSDPAEAPATTEDNSPVTTPDPAAPTTPR